MTPEKYLPRMTLNNHQSCFNAFALGFADMAMQDEVYGLSDLAHLPAYQALLEKLGIPSWELFVEYLHAIDNQPVTLQEHLGWVLAAIALERISKDAMFDDIKSVFHHYIVGRCGFKLCDEGYADQQLAKFPFLTPCFEDIGREFLRQRRTGSLKFSDIDEACLTPLKQWWTERGHKELVKYSVSTQAQLNHLCFELMEAAFQIRVVSPTEVPVDLGDVLVERQIEMRQKTKNQWEYFQHPRLGKIRFPMLQAGQAKSLVGALEVKFKKLKTSDQENDPTVVAETMQKWN